MTVVVIDGPEKAGKSTLIQAICEAVEQAFAAGSGGPHSVYGSYSPVVRKWGPLDDGRWSVDSVYRDALCKDVGFDGLVLWDRSWASESVYARLLGRDRRLGADPWLGEWLYGRGVPTKIILWPNPEVSGAARTPDDLPVKPSLECAEFAAYARKYGWHLVDSTFGIDRRPVDDLVKEVLGLVGLADQANPREVCGPADSPVLFVGERASRRDTLVGGWLPFSSRYTTDYGRVVGDLALRCRWTNAWDDRRQELMGRSLVVACGATARDWVYDAIRTEGVGPTCLFVPHPAALYRWGKLRPLIQETEDAIHRAVRNAFDDPRPAGAFQTGVLNAKAAR